MDGGFALAYVGLASAHLALGFLAPKESYPKAAAAASRALDLDDGLAEAHAVLGAEKAAFEYDWHEAESQLTRAIALKSQLGLCALSLLRLLSDASRPVRSGHP